MVPLVPKADENVVVKLPEMTNHMAREPSTINTINMTEQFPVISFPGCEPTLTALDVLEPHLRSVVDPLYDYPVCLPKAIEHKQASTAGSCVTVWFFSSGVKYDRSLTTLSTQDKQEDNLSTLEHSLDVSEESSAESSLDLHSVDVESIVTDSCGTVSTYVLFTYAQRPYSSTGPTRQVGTCLSLSGYLRGGSF